MPQPDKTAKAGRKTTVTRFAELKRLGRPIAALSLYDAPTARLAAAAGVELLLVGDSLGMAVLGHPDTLRVTMDDIVHHCAAVARGAPNAFIVADMPFMSCRLGAPRALENAARCVQQGGADAVKIEGGEPAIVSLVAEMVDAGVPVMGHLGLLPQRSLVAGGYRMAGKSGDARRRILEQASALQAAGAFSVVLECVPPDLGRELSRSLDIPVIGIGAGPDCDGQIQVASDILGMFPDFLPHHARRYANLAATIADAFHAYAADVANRTFAPEGGRPAADAASADANAGGADAAMDAGAGAGKAK